MNVPLAVLGTGILMLIVEQWRPARAQATDVNWWLRALLLNSAQAAVALLGAATWDIWFTALTPLVASGLPSVAEIGIGYLWVTFVYYWWHRARHTSPSLWRWLHRVHHSPQRIEVITSFYKHPFELVCNGLLTSVLLTPVLGLTPAQVATVVLITGLAELFYHWNVRTPYWLGWLFQRPEMHRVHHQRGVHTSNFSDLPVWDLLFGTFSNPRADTCACGFPDDARLLHLLRGQPVIEQ